MGWERATTRGTGEGVAGRGGESDERGTGEHDERRGGSRRETQGKATYDLGGVGGGLIGGDAREFECCVLCFRLCFIC